MKALERFAQRLGRRLRPFGDLTAWTLIVISLVPLWFISRSMVLTLVQWAAFSLALAGISVIVSRVVMPQVDMSEWIERARKGDVGSALIVLGLFIFVGLLILSMVLWSKS